MDSYDIAVIGAGAAGTMAAIRAAQLKKRVLLLEKNGSIGRKILLTGKGRCNVTNNASVDTFIEKFGKHGPFLRTAFHTFFNRDAMEFFESAGLRLKIERQGRVFPVTDRASSVVEVLEKYVRRCGVALHCGKRLEDMRRTGDGFRLRCADGSSYTAVKTVVATGGASYKKTGSSGDGYRVARRLGHTVVALTPALVPLTVKESWVRGLQGLTLRNARLTFVADKKKLDTAVGELLFTHFGVSGPLVLDISSVVISLLEVRREVTLLIDLKPGLTAIELDKRLLRELGRRGARQIQNIFKRLLPVRLISTVLDLAGIACDKQCGQITYKERQTLSSLLKALPLTITGSLPLERAMVTNGGISLKEINPRTMESKIVSGLFFAGEIIDGCAASGGYNLQQAFSTGYLAGEGAARCVK